MVGLLQVNVGSYARKLGSAVVVVVGFNYISHTSSYDTAMYVGYSTVHRFQTKFK